MTTMDYSLLETLVVRMIDQGKLPETLYKYRAIDSRLDDIIKKRELWFADAASFNDPFDGNIIFDSDNTVDEIERFFKSMASELPASVTNADIRRKAEEIKANHARWHDMINGAAQRQMRKWGICCFSQAWDGILQWSHYAKYHEGVALGFGVRQDPLLFTIPLHVDYVTDYPVYNYLRNQKECVEGLLRTKAKAWEYEKEVRVMRWPQGALRFDPKALTEITFGMRAKSDEIDRVRALVKSEGLGHVQFYQARMADRRYAIERDLI